MNTDKIYIYDTENYPNLFLFVAKHYVTGQFYTFEWSERINQIPELINFIHALGTTGSKLIGFNSIAYDYPIIHYIVTKYPSITLLDIFHKTESIIHAPREQRFNHIIWDHNRIVEQIDLFSLMHYDNPAKFTSLKILEFNMRMSNIQDLPYNPGNALFKSMIDPLTEYCKHDVNATEMFFEKCIPAIELREKLGVNVNWNDAKIGKQFFIDKLEKQTPGICFRKTPEGRKPNQTIYESVAIGDLLLPYIKFEHPEFQRVHQWFKDRVITETKGAIKDLTAEIDGLIYNFGTGGLHASIDSTVICSDSDYVTLDWDVKSYYPNLAISNRIFPKHLSENFCDIYEDLYEERKRHPKGTPENLAIKLALNASFGNAGNKYSPFYDIAYLLAITINGQLSLCMLAEQIHKIKSVTFIQANTDGITFKIHKDDIDFAHEIYKWWERITGLELEEAIYFRMMIRDVNNYIAEYESGKLKRKGAYEYKLGWEKNHSMLVVPMAAEAFLVRGIEPAEFLIKHQNKMDFMLRTKVPRSSRLFLGTGEPLEWSKSSKKPTRYTDEKRLQNISRYYVSNKGGSLIKIMPPLAKKPGVFRRIGINVGWKVTECNNLCEMAPLDINYRFYMEEVEKLISYAR